MPTRKLILYEIFPLSPEPLSFNEKRAAAINGTGITASKWVSALEKLTLRNELRFLTLLSWANVLKKYKLLRRFLTWCPLCYKKWRETGHEIYQPLLWTIQVVVLCPIHLIPLHFKCPNPDCKKEQLILGKKSRPGYCYACSQWLGVLPEEETSNRRIFNDNDIKWQKWVINVVGELLAAAPDLTILPERKIIAETLSGFASLMDSDINTLTREIGTTIVSMRNWMKGKISPHLELLLRICYYFRTSAIQFFTGTSLDGHSGELNTPIWDKTLRKRPKLDHGKIRQEMEKILENENPPVPISEIRKRLGCSNFTLYKYFPDLYRAISTKYRDYRKQCSTQKLQRICEKIQSLAKQIHAEGKYPSMYQIQKRDSSGIFWHPGTIAAWHAVIKELGWEVE